MIYKKHKKGPGPFLRDCPPSLKKEPVVHTQYLSNTFNIDIDAKSVIANGVKQYHKAEVSLRAQRGNPQFLSLRAQRGNLIRKL